MILTTPPRRLYKCLSCGQKSPVPTADGLCFECWKLLSRRINRRWVGGSRGSVPYSSGLIADWELGDSRWLDSLGKYNLFAVGSPAIVPGFGAFPTVTQFNGSSLLGYAGPVIASNPWTLTAWFNYSAFGGKIYQQLAGVSVMQALYTTGPSHMITGTADGSHFVVGSTGLSVGGWHFGVLTYDGSVMNLYIDGVLDGSAMIPSNYSGITETDIGPIGFQGSIGPVAVYNRVLSPADISNQWNNGNGIIL